MLSYEDAGDILDELMDEIPGEIFCNLNGGVSLVEESRQSDDGRYTLGTYFRNEMGKYIEIYYGSFYELYGEMSDELFRQRLENTLKHELTHHIENQAGDRSLEHWDERQSELYGFNGIDVKSILFVCDDNTLSMAAESIFNANKQGKSSVVYSHSAGLKAAEEIPSKLRKLCEGMNITLNKIPESVTRELVESHDVVLCMSIEQCESLSKAYQDLDERIMCLAEEDILPPSLSLGWKKCIERLYDEVLAVIDELNQEDE